MLPADGRRAIGIAERLVTRNFLALGSGEAVARLVAFGATVYIARQLGAAAYGVIGFATAVVLYLNRIADAGIDLGLGVREVAAGPQHLRRAGSSILTLRALLALGLVAVCGTVGFVALPAPDGHVVALYTLTLFPLAASTRWIHLGLEDSRLVAVARSAGELLMVGLVLLTVHHAGDLARVPLAQFCGDALAALLLAAALRRRGFRFPLRLDMEIVRPLVRRAAPLVAASLLGLMIYNADMIFLRFLRGTADVGYYAAAYTLISFLINLGIAYSLSLLPTLTRLEADPRAQHALYHTAIAHVYAVALPLAVGGVLVSAKIVRLVFGAEFGPAAIALGILLFSIPLSLVRDIPIIALMSRGRERLVLQVTAIAAALNVVLNALLIPPYGIAGAAAATAVTEGVRMVIAGLLARRQGFPLVSVARLWRASAAALAMGGIVWPIAGVSLAVSVPAGAVAYGLALWAVGGIRISPGAPPTLTV